jgi:hypothetical protein
LFLRRAGFGIDGSDQMNLVIVGAAWLAIVVGRTPEALRIGLWFVAAQSVLSYGINGTTKLAARSWRSGRAMAAALSTYTNGDPALYRVVAARPWLGLAACWVTIVWEAAFPIVMVVPEPVVLPILISGALFHLSLAYAMGIHLFVWAFIAPYVAIWMVTR